ncbi:MAG TPA: hypothetical protein VMN79_05600 [Casimicrobiaceae bacterium]|nr:hypothetical protein [Casimicrobiaceae bacterium]
MKKYPIVVAKKQPVERRKRPVARAARALPAVLPDPSVASMPAPGFLSFRYSFTEISAADGTARMRSRRAAYEDGKLVSESFEGELERGAYDRAVGEANARFADEAASLLRSFFPFLR